MPVPVKLRLGVIGAGAFAQACHIPGLQSHPQAEVVALCGRRSGPARTIADKFAIRDVHTDFQELCARPDIDAITVATPNVAHADQVHATLGHGKHVFCEKPLGIHVPEVRKMVEAAHRSGKVHQVGFTFRYNYGIRELRRRVRRGDIGQPFYVRVQYDSWEGMRPDWKIGWREKQELAGGGLLFDVGSHLFDIARHVLGPINEVIGFTHHIPRVAIGHENQEKTDVETDDLANIWFRNITGVRGQFFVSRITPPFAQIGYLEVIGAEGAMKAALSRGGVDFLKLSRPLAPEWIDIPLVEEAGDRQPHALGIMMRSFVDSCLRGIIDSELDASFDDGLAAQEAIDAVLVSQQQHRWARLN